MKVRKLKKLRQEKAGWPETSSYPSEYGRQQEYFDYYCEPRKVVHPKITIISWKVHQWRNK